MRLPASGRVMVYGNRKDEDLVRRILDRLGQGIKIVDWLHFTAGVMSHGHQLPFLSKIFRIPLLPAAIVINHWVDDKFRLAPSKKTLTLVLIASVFEPYCDPIRILLQHHFPPGKPFETIPFDQLARKLRDLLLQKQDHFELVPLDGLKELNSDLAQLPKEDIYIYGAGGRGMECKRWLEKDLAIPVHGWFDGDRRKQGQSILGRKVHALADEVPQRHIGAIVVASQYTDEILATIVNHGSPRIIRNTFIYESFSIRHWLLFAADCG